MHEAKFGRVALIGRFAQIGLKRGEQGGFMPFQPTGKFLELLATEFHPTRCAGLKEGPMALDGGGEIHNQLGRTSPAGYSWVKR